MAVTLIGSNGIFTRLGKLFFVIEEIIGHQTDSSGGLKEEMEDILDEYTGADSHMLAGMSTQILQTQLNAGNPIVGILLQVAEQTVIEMVNDDTNKLPDRSIHTAIVELIDQMGNNTDDVQVNGSVTSTPTAKGANTGNGTIVTAVTKPMGPDVGDEWQNARDERIEVKCTVDAQESGTAGRETFVARGEPALGDIRHPDWPDGSTAKSGAGSGSVVTMRVSDPSENSQKSIGRNMLFNSAFETFTVTNTPDNWVLNTGSAGTDFLEEGTVIYRGSKCLELVGDNSTQHDLSQALNTSGQSTSKMGAEQKYIVFFRVSAAGSGPTGIVRISIKDGADSILNSGAAAVSTDLSSISTGGTFDLKSFTFNSPLDIPSTVKIVIEATTAIGSSDILYIDDLCLCEMHQVGGKSGTYMVVTPGSTAFIRDDIIHVVIVNNHAGKIQKYFDRLFGMSGAGLQLPIDASPTVADSLVA